MKSKIRSILADRAAAIVRDTDAGGSYEGLFDDDDFLEELQGLVDDMIAPKPYIDAAKAGRAAVDGYQDRAIDPYALGQAHASYRRQYAENVPPRISANLAQWLNAMPGETIADPDAMWAAVDAKIAQLGADVTRYADPPWSAGMAGYGNQLGAFEVLLVWVLDDGVDHCDECPVLASESPYAADEIPTWPKQGDTPCLDRCYCEIHADEQSWKDAFGEQAG